MELEALFTKLQQVCRETPYFPIPERRQELLRLRSLLKERANDLAEAVNRDFSHRAYHETILLEIFPTIRAINYCLRHLKKWTKVRKRDVSWLFKPSYAYVSPQPLGVVGIMVPWNYPIFLAIVPLVYALAAGNCVMFKFSELMPHTGQALELLLNNLDRKERISCVHGDVEVAKQFSALAFGHLLFTGSTTVGKQVMAAASKNLTPVTLELGGKSPAILSKTTRFNDLKRLFFGKLVNAGQTCIAPDYLLIPLHWEGQVEALFGKFLAECYPNLLVNTNYSAIISHEHRERLEAMVEDARKKGARIVSFGQSEDDNKKMPFYLVFGANDSMRVMQEEIFGPILPLLTYHNFEEAITFINSRATPLAIYYFGDDGSEKNQLTKKTRSGALTINDTLTHIAIDDLPFGGVGLSGMGHYHGQEGFDSFSKLKPVFVQRRFAPVTWLYPPYGLIARYFLRWIVGIPNRKNE